MFFDSQYAGFYSRRYLIYMETDDALSILPSIKWVLGMPLTETL
jgi:hypothetical protein